MDAWIERTEACGGQSRTVGRRSGASGSP
jgi:hypothetical protein